MSWCGGDNGGSHAVVSGGGEGSTWKSALWFISTEGSILQVHTHPWLSSPAPPMKLWSFTVACLAVRRHHQQPLYTATSGGHARNRRNQRHTKKYTINLLSSGNRLLAAQAVTLTHAHTKTHTPSYMHSHSLSHSHTHKHSYTQK